MMDPLTQAIRAAVLQAFEERDRMNESTGAPRLVSVERAAQYIDASEREIHNMIARGELPVVRHGRRVKLDLRDIDQWIKLNKAIERSSVAA